MTHSTPVKFLQDPWKVSSKFCRFLEASWDREKNSFLANPVCEQSKLETVALRGENKQRKQNKKLLFGKKTKETKQKKT